MKKMLAMAALALPLFASGYAAAGEYAPLSDGQMDGVTAGGSAQALAAALAEGNAVLTLAATATEVAVVGTFSSEVTTINWVGSSALSLAAASAN